jgi:hypothetical protein
MNSISCLVKHTVLEGHGFTVISGLMIIPDRLLENMSVRIEILDGVVMKTFLTIQGKF